MSKEQDQYIGEVFEDLDPRSDGRRIRVKGLHENQRQTVKQQAHEPARGGKPRAFVVEVVGASGSAQRKTRVSTLTLDTRFRKVSH